MAQQNPQIRANNQTVCQLKSINDEIIMEIGSTDYTLKDSSGALTRRGIHTSIQLATGEFWNPGIMKTMPIGVCPECRRKKISHGICTLKSLKPCCDCGLPICPACRKKGIDNKYRCAKHHRIHCIKSFVISIFFKKKA